MASIFEYPSVCESIEILGLYDQKCWKRVVSGEAKNVEWIARWRVWDFRRCQGTRAIQAAHVYKLGAMYMPTIALAFQEELSTYFLKPVRRPLPSNTDTLVFSTLFYQLHCSSYFAKWCRKGGEDFRSFLHFMWKYVCQLTLEDMELSNPHERVSTHLLALSNALQYASHPIPPHLSFLPPNPSKDRTVFKVRLLLANLLVRIDTDPNFISFNKLVANRYRTVTEVFFAWLEAEGREPKAPQFEMERWEVCAGGSLIGCDAKSWETGCLKACSKCESVGYCSVDHQKKHWAGQGLRQYNQPVPLVFAHKGMCFESSF